MLQQQSEHPREMVVTPKASTSNFGDVYFGDQPLPGYRLPIRGKKARRAHTTKPESSKSLAVNPPEVSSISGTFSVRLPPSYPRRKHARREHRNQAKVSETLGPNLPEVSSISGTISARGSCVRLPPPYPRRKHSRRDRPNQTRVEESFAENPPEISSISGTSISGTSILGTTSTWLPPSYPRRKHARRKRPKLGLSESFAENPPEISSISGTISARGYRLPIRGESIRGESVPTKLGSSESFAENPPEISSISGTISARGSCVRHSGHFRAAWLRPTKMCCMHE